MKDKELNAFLASVRRTRFVDYLDPLGETAQNAFERRLSWARVSQHDPAYADEARFLLDHAEELREVLRRELEEDDWVEEADVGREWDTRSQPRTSRLRENDRITEIFQADDMDVSSAPQKHQSQKHAGGSDKGGSGRGVPAGKQARPQPSKTARAALAEETDETRVDRTQQGSAGARRTSAPQSERSPRSVVPSAPSPRMDSVRLRDGEVRGGPLRTDSLRDVEPPVKRPATLPPVQRAPVSRPPSSRSADERTSDPRTAGGRLIGREPPPREPSRAPSSRPPPAPSGGTAPRNSAPSLSPTRMTGGMAGASSTGAPSRNPKSIPPSRLVDGPPPARAGSSAPSRSSGAGGGTVGRPGAPGRPRGRGETAERAEFAPRLAEPRSPQRPLRAMAEDEETRNPVAGEVELEDWDAPDEPSTGIMRLEDVTAPPMKAVNPHDDTVALPSSQVMVDAGATRPSLPTRMRRPGSSPLGGETRIRKPPASNRTDGSGTRAAMGDDVSPRRRSWFVRIVVVLLLLLVVGGVVTGGVALVGGGAFAFSSDWVGDLWTQLYAPDTSPVVPKPAPVKPTPVQEAAVPPPGGGTANPPVPVAPQPTGAPGGAVTPPPAPPPPVQPSKAKVAKPTPTVRPAPGVAEATGSGTASPAPSVSTAPPTDVRGLWVGQTDKGTSFKLTVLGQDPVEGGFEGTVEIQLEDGTFDSLAVNGKVDGTGTMSFKGGGSSFNAAVNGRRASGSYTLQGGSKAQWTAVH